MSDKSTFKVARHAVCFLLMNDDGLVLALSRGKDLGSWGMPGGKVEANESLNMALVRETYEETGFVVANPQAVYTAFVPGEINFICTTFIGQVVAAAEDAPRSWPFEGECKWVKPKVLVEGPFGDYNRSLFQEMNVDWRDQE